MVISGFNKLNHYFTPEVTSEFNRLNHCFTPEVTSEFNKLNHCFSPEVTSGFNRLNHCFSPEVTSEFNKLNHYFSPEVTSEFSISPYPFLHRHLNQNLMHIIILQKSPPSKIKKPPIHENQVPLFPYFLNHPSACI